MENDMSFVGKAIGKVVGGITGSNDAAKAAERAGQTQAAAAQAGIKEQRRQFDELVKLLSPFVQAGTGSPGVTGSVQAQQELLGLRGADPQRAAIRGLEQGPIMQALLRQGEEAILQRASATGGLRGGNVQAALGQFRPQLLSDLIQQQFQNLGGLTQVGQASAAGQATAGLQTGTNVSNLLQQQGAARAGGQIAAGSAQRQAFGDLLSIAGVASGF
jgi:hypothetical protein